MKRLALAPVLGVVAMTGCSKRQAAQFPQPPVIVSKPAAVQEAPPAPKPSPTRRSSAPTPRAAAETAAAAEPMISSPPALEAMTTPAERRDTIETVDASLNRAEANLAQLRDKPLTNESQRDASRVRSFVQQARESLRNNDLATAREFALRAEVLSRDLLKR